eukprot:GFUD01000409.1.p1 GENE.GFUD01000409.1~~GFUD01000409.1.p1  ORF type:complete len:1950 (+),score=514.17 GFUD01000409.1:338-5851(+)
MAEYKFSMVRQEPLLEIDQTVLITLQNKNEHNVIKLPKGLAVAKALVLNNDNVLEASNSPSYCLQFIRHYFKTYRLDDINQKSDHIIFGAEFTTSFHKNQRTNFRIWGTNYSCGLQDYYSVETIVYFLHQVKSMEDPYEDYLRLALTYNKPIVRLNDFKSLYQYLYEEVAMCEEIDKNFTVEKDTELTLLYEQNLISDINIHIDEYKHKEEVHDDEHVQNDTDHEETSKPKPDNPNLNLINKLKEYLLYDYNMNLSQAVQEIKLLVKVLNEIGYQLGKLRVDYFAVPKHRQLFKDIFKIKMEEKMKDNGFGGAKEANDMMIATMESLKLLSKPQTVKQMKVFIEMTNLFQNEIFGSDTGTMCKKLKEQMLAKCPTDTYDWDDELELVFESLKESISSMTSLKPPTEDGKMDFYSAASETCLANIIVQEQEGKRHPIGYNSRLLSPSEEKLSKIEKEGIAVIWGVNVNRHILLGSEFSMKVSSHELRSMFTPGNENTADWSAKVDQFQYQVDDVMESKNPAIALTIKNENDIKCYEKTELILDLFNQMLNVMKKSAKDRNRWLKYKMKKLKKNFYENLSKSLGEAETGNFDFEFAGQKNAPQGTAILKTSTRSKGSIQCGPTIDFIVASSSTIKSTKSGDVEISDIVERQKSFPDCIVGQFQPLFEVFFSHLVGIKNLEWNIAEERANKTFTKLMIHGVDYFCLKNLVAKVTMNSKDFSQESLEKTIDSFLSNKGVDNVYCKEGFLRNVVEHFKMALNLRQKIKIKLNRGISSEKVDKPENCDTEAAQEVEEREDSIAASDPESIEVQTEFTSKTSEHPSWFLDLLESDMDTPETNQRTNWSSNNIMKQPNESHTDQEPDEIAEIGNSNSFDKLEDYYNKMIKALPSDERKHFRTFKIDGKELCKCWIIAHLDLRNLNFLYKESCGMGRKAVLNKLDAALCTYRVLLPKGVDMSVLSKWTFRYFKTNDNNIGSLHSLYQRKAIMRLQRENTDKNEFEDLKNYFSTIMIQCHNRKLEEAVEIASDCIQTFELCGFSLGTLTSLFTTATSIPACLESLYSSLMLMFESISCLLPQTVDIERLIKYTLVYFKAKQELDIQISSGSNSSSDNFMTLHPLVLHCSQVINGDFARKNVKNVGSIVVKDQVIILPGETVSVRGKLSWTEKKPPVEGTHLQMTTHDFTKIAHSSVHVEPTTWHYKGADVEVSLKNTNKKSTSALGNPGRYLYIANVTMIPPDEYKVKDLCEKSAKFLSENHIDINKLAGMYQNVVKDTIGCRKSVPRVALEHAFKKLATEKCLGLENIFMFEPFIHQSLLYSSKLKITTDLLGESKKNLKELGEPMEIPEADIEEGECLSDDDDEPDVKLCEKSPEVDTEEDEEDVGGMISFHGNICTQEQLSDQTNDVIVPMDIIRLIKNHNQDIDLTQKFDNTVIVDNLEVNLNTNIDFTDGISYNIESLILFVKNMNQPHPVYIKKVSNIDPDISLVHMDHRKILMDAFTGTAFEKVIELPIMSTEAKLRRLHKQFEKLFARTGTIPGSMPQTKFSEFQPLFDKYFIAIYLSGLKCQKNWLEVSRVAAEDLVNCWLSADFQYTHLLRNITKVKGRARQSEKKKKERYKRIFRYFHDELVQNIDKMPLALNLKLFVKNTIEFMDEIVRLNKMWETDIFDSDKEVCEEDNGTSDIEIIEVEQSEHIKELKDKDEKTSQSSDDDVIHDEELIKKLKDIRESQELTNLSEEDLNKRIADLKHQLSTEDCEQETGEPSADLSVGKLKELSAFVSKYGAKDDEDSEEISSTDDEGKFSDGDDENEKTKSEEILKSFVREISEERKKEKLLETDEGEISS